VHRSTSMQKTPRADRNLGNTRSHDSIAVSRRFVLLGLMERLATESVRAGIDRQQQNPAISGREGATVQALL
jgi:hypothetical protein